MGYIYLVLAIIAEVIGTTALQACDGFTRFIPSSIVVIGYGLAFYFLSLVLRSIPMGVAYAIWGRARHCPDFCGRRFCLQADS